MTRLIFLVFLFSSVGSFSQDTIRVMYYNLLNFPDVSPERVVQLRQIIGYVKPDVLVVNELLTETGANLILNDALNVWGTDKYIGANFMDGPDTDNMLFYNSDLLGFIGQQQIPTGLRDFSEYQLFYKSPSLVVGSDTIYLNFFSAHLKAGSGYFNQRKEEAIILKYHLNSIPHTENIFIGGDFNFYSGNESGCLAIRETGDIEMFDPIESIGDWNNNISYANIHTQSTRTSPLADGAGGGLDDRFDLIFVSEDVLNNQNGLNFIPDSYKALGQDGDRFNGGIYVPFNPIIPDSIANALFYMSDHLPVLMDLKTDYTAQINLDNPNAFSWRYNSSSNTLLLDLSKEMAQEIEKNALFSLLDLSGKIIAQFKVESTHSIQIPTGLSNGILFWNITSESHYISGKILKQY